MEAIDENGRTFRFSARYVVDASGRETFLANRMKTKSAHRELERTALHSHWSGMDYAGGLADGLIQIVYLGSEKQGWIWVIPLGTDRISVGVVMNTAYYRHQRAALKEAGVEDWQTALYLQEVMTSPYLAQATAQATRIWPVAYEGDYSYTVGNKWGDNYALVGDASAFIDPIFSSGVYLAMKSARLLAASLDIQLRAGGTAGADAMKET